MKHMLFEVWISVDGVALPEYMPSFDDNTATCFIPSEAGRHFTVHWRDEGTGKLTGTYINVDGHKFPGKYLNGSGEAKRSGVRMSNNTEAPFMFQKMLLGPESIPDKLDASQEVGIIELKVVAGERGEQQAVDPIHGVPVPLGPEYAFATGGHTIAYGKERPCPPRVDHTYAFKYKSPEEKRSMIKFKFRYRPMMWLLKYSIVTLSPPSPQKSSASGSGKIASPALPGQGLLINSIPKVESSPSPQGIMLVPSRSKKSVSSQSKKGKEVYSASTSSSSANPLSIVDMQRKYYRASGQFSEHELPQPPQYGQPISGYPSSVIDTTRFMGSPSLSSDGSGPSGSDLSTPHSQYWDVSIDTPMSNEPAQWMNLVQFSSMYPGQQNYSQAGYGKY